MIILDTNVISEALRREPDAAVVAWLASLVGDVAITSVTLAELLAGVGRLPDGRRKTTLLAVIEEAVEPYRDGRSILAFDDAAARQYAQVLVVRDAAGLPISTADAQIAAICRVHHAALATRNLKDFECTGLELVDPWNGR
ncbi:MAG TPA: type II toxin-antitoxin system VapC family toxin [Gordonia sp. (in: high G+C Gram-positive bacteria)]|uniref:type II toxin-antitoxin system VapC family toxin n=1 Tax=unclassified Gordonia (in: high G+C Gram-positive bacteria) TaxID=2657482 RepID=UPI000FBB029D|nr:MULTISPECIES: type II toxin-antitoxin system VapC family toxin [unclassified Gordonia (in: high G+C Gram-positive bacteria)]RUP41040.1 MAG: type II toxin-antitoxin system VapC family toxin [Gordonia sp. (in: high G+C Gram-positive bacteria)]HNP56945.1 type II toxin-antitoxin system VapC family toxin [Gordonia sp. (in: high G+C Gram-positive bacteria)]HRC50389.1 type II toxin-antitoxin system VapC family toxin [Gordonia sp. (in: high G+C Gram-positive bacteria)]